MSEAADAPLFEPDPTFAAGWFIEDPVAQGAFKHASITILDVLDEAAHEAGTSEPDLGDLGPLGIFPRSVRPALTQALVDRMRTTAIVVGWKLAQPGPAIAPCCIAEELALELIRQEAISALELVETSQASILATKGVYEVCEDDDVLDLFAMHEPADAAIALSDPVNIAMGKADMRIERWFESFSGEDPGSAPHPDYLEPLITPCHSAPERQLAVVSPEPAGVQAGPDDQHFRVCIRTWEDGFADRDAYDWIPDTWIYYVDAASAGAAQDDALKHFPHGAASHVVFDNPDDVRLGRQGLSRISIDVQRVHLDQRFKHASAFHIVGTSRRLPRELLPKLAGHLSATFETAVVAYDSETVFLGVSMNAESHAEAEADLDDAFGVLADALGLEQDPLDSYFSKHGPRNATELLTEMQSYDP